MTGRRSHEYKDFCLVQLRLRFAMILVLLVYALPSGGQTLNSSQADGSAPASDLSSMLNSKHGGSGFGVADAGFSDAVDAGLQSYSDSIGVDTSSQFTGGLTGSGGGKSSAFVRQLLVSGSAPSMMTPKAQSMRSRGTRGSSEFTQKEIATRALTGAAASSLGASIAFSKAMESGPPSDAEEQEPTSEGAAAMESSAAFEGISTSQNGLEAISDPFKPSQGASSESLCGEGCSQLIHFSLTEDRRNIIESHEQTLAHHLSRSATRLSLSNSATSENSGKYFGRIAAQESKLHGGSLIDAKSIGTVSNDQR